MALDIFIDEEDESKLPELVRLRIRKGWTQYQVALAVNLSVIDYADIEYGRVKNPKLETRVKEILESNDGFSPLFFLPKPPEFQPEREYKFIRQIFADGSKKDKKNETATQRLIFVKPCKGANGFTHFLFRNKGGCLESFTQVQLMDYRLERCE